MPRVPPEAIQSEIRLDRALSPLLVGIERFGRIEVVDSNKADTYN